MTEALEVPLSIAEEGEVEESPDMVEEIADAEMSRVVEGPRRGELERRTRAKNAALLASPDLRVYKPKITVAPDWYVAPEQAPKKKAAKKT